MIATDMNPISSDVWSPFIRRRNMSWPIWFVPSGCSSDGGSMDSRQAGGLYSSPVTVGTMIARATRVAIRNRAMTASRCGQEPLADQHPVGANRDEIDLILVSATRGWWRRHAGATVLSMRSISALST